MTGLPITWTGCTASIPRGNALLSLLNTDLGLLSLSVLQQRTT